LKEHARQQVQEQTPKEDRHQHHSDCKCHLKSKMAKQMETGFYEHPMMPHGMPNFDQCPPYFLQMMHFYHLKMMEYYQMNKMNEGMKSMGFPSSIFPPLEGKSPNCSHQKPGNGQQQHQSGC